MKRLLSGNEAVAHGAWEAGVAVASGYPGTPSTEIMETFALFPGVYAEWAPNEKVALDVAIGAAYAGRRALSTMKHVGVNVAADAIFYASMSGAEAGLVLVSADDPSMHSSQNEQDNRQYAKFTRTPCLEPADGQEAKDMTIAAYNLSERFDTPVILRMTTRTCHTRTLVDISEQRQQPSPPKTYPRNIEKYVDMPANARKRHLVIEQRIRDLVDFAESFPQNFVTMKSTHLGIITSGIASQYAQDVFPDASILKLGMVYPLPIHLIHDFAQTVERLVVIEELDPFIENEIRLMGIKLFEGERPLTSGRYPNRKSIFPLTGELDPGVVRLSAEKAGLLKGISKSSVQPLEITIPQRPPVLCPGCPHRSSFYVLNKLKVPVNGDIGCYTLGVIPPLNAIHTTGAMGSSIGVAHGAAVAGDNERHVAVLGDSTFFHTGIPALLNVAYNQSNVITIIMDNRVTGMTGHQQNPGTGKTLQNKNTVAVNLEAIVRSLGIERVKTVAAYDVKAIEKTLKEWMKDDKPAVLITREECALLPNARQRYLPLEVNSDICNGCTICFRIGCPSLSKSDQLHPVLNRPLAKIDPQLCTGCQICAQVCPRNAILFRQQILGKKQKEIETLEEK
jgi:indolepyruvate ferredoxin oxidoreductase alpha subunit